MSHQHPEGSGALDQTNRPTWTRVRHEFVVEGWQDVGELAMFLRLADEFRGRRVLDIGVGAGRTVPLLLLLSQDYVAVDYTTELVDLCHQRYPSVEVRHDDARSLKTLPASSVDPAVFSANGIDAVDHNGRMEVYRSVRRVLRPGGMFAFSTLNKDGAFFGATPADATHPPWLPGSLTKRPEGERHTSDADTSEDVAWTRAVRNWRATRGQLQDHDEWGIAPFAAHEFSLLVHFVTRDGLLRELDAMDFACEAIYPCDRRDALEPGEVSDALYLNVMARSPG